MTNPALKDMVKIGFATDVEGRRRQLSTTALPYEYEVYATYETSGNLEDKKLHKMIDNLNNSHNQRHEGQAEKSQSSRYKKTESEKTAGKLCQVRDSDWC